MERTIDEARTGGTARPPAPGPHRGGDPPRARARRPVPVRARRGTRASRSPRCPSSSPAPGTPSLETLWALSVALDVPFSRLVHLPSRPRVTVLRRGEGTTVTSERAHYVATLLASCPPSARRDIYLLSVEPGPPRESDPHQPGTMEHAVIGTGGRLVGPADQPVELGPGDYMCYPGDVPHVRRPRTRHHRDHRPWSTSSCSPRSPAHPGPRDPGGPGRSTPGAGAGVRAGGDTVLHPAELSPLAGG